MPPEVELEVFLMISRRITHSSISHDVPRTTLSLETKKQGRKHHNACQTVVTVASHKQLLYTARMHQKGIVLGQTHTEKCCSCSSHITGERRKQTYRSGALDMLLQHLHLAFSSPDYPTVQISKIFVQCNACSVCSWSSSLI